MLRVPGQPLREWSTEEDLEQRKGLRINSYHGLLEPIYRRNHWSIGQSVGATRSPLG